MPQGYISGHVILLLLLSAYLFISVCLKHCVLTRRQRTKLYTDTHTQHSFLFGKKKVEHKNAMHPQFFYFIYLNYIQEEVEVSISLAHRLLHSSTHRVY